ncbi:MAG: hypothetical protein Q7J31_17635 [Syntrophales bacterium]|nr:hypothetical protein [Syntrophales bacterium]
MKLYRISEEHIKTLLMEGHQENYSQGRFTYTEDMPGFKYPLKVIVQKEGDTCTIITVYPLKRREMKHEGVI